MSKIIVAVEKKLLKFIISVFYRIVPLSIYLFLTDGWAVKRSKKDKLVFPFVKKRKQSCFQILLYHRVNDEQDPFFSGVPVKLFERQMEMLRDYFNVLPLEETMDRILQDDIPSNTIAITFDDGYRDNYVNAFPILKKLGLSATIFLTTGALNSKSPLWHDRVFHAFRLTKSEYLSINENKYPLKSNSEKIFAMNCFLQNLRKCIPHERDMRIQQLILNLGVSESASTIKEEMLNWHEIQVMSMNNISFGAHTESHPILTQMSLDEAVDEILTSKKAIESKLGSPVRLFAYPNGGRNDFNDSIKDALKKADLLCGVTTIWGTNNILTDPYELRRIQAWGSDPRMSAWRFGWYKFLSLN